MSRISRPRKSAGSERLDMHRSRILNLTTIRSSSIIVCVTAFVLSVSIGLLPSVRDAAVGSQTHADPARAADQRFGEAVIVPGDALTAFHGMATIAIAGYAYNDEGWTRVPIQIDERDDTDVFVDGEDGRLDSNDELVFLLENAGGMAPDSVPPGSGIGPARRIDITDPLDPAFLQHLYLLSADGPLLGPEGPAIAWDPETRELSTASYVLGFASSDPVADGYSGIKRISLFGDEADLIDRLKIRAKIVSPLGELEITEEDFGGLGDLIPGAGDLSLDIEPIIVGPVRAVLDATGGGSAYPARATVFNALDGFELPDLGGIVEFDVSDVRVSLDHSPAASGALYRDANTLEGVTIDGDPETLGGSTVPAWREVSLPGGRMVFVAGSNAADREGADADLYYVDDAAGMAGDTGDGASYGDHGVTAASLIDLAATGFPGELVVLPLPMEISADLLAEAALTPLEIAVVESGLDVIEPTAAPPTPTSAVEPSPTTASTPGPGGTPEPTPGGGGSGPSVIYLALATRNW